MKLEGMSAQGIAGKLNQSGVLSPMEYKRFLGLKFHTTFKVNPTAKWQSCTVKRILTNAVYTGVLEQGKRTKPNYKVRKCAEVPKEQWICREDSHDAIIDPAVFETVRRLLKQDTHAPRQGSAVFPLSGVIVCGDCGAAMIRKNYTKKDGGRETFYVCSRHRADTKVCSTHIISASACEKAVLDALRVHVAAVLNVEKALACAEGMAYRRDGVRKLTARLEAKQDEIGKYKGYRLSLHESYRDGVISKADFISFKESYDVKIADAETAVVSLKEEIERTAAGEAESHDWINKFRACAAARTLERKTVAELIERVAVYDGSRIEVVFRHYDEFMRLQVAVKGAA
jgi:hypothetical protein